MGGVVRIIGCYHSSCVSDLSIHLSEQSLTYRDKLRHSRSRALLLRPPGPDFQLIPKRILLLLPGLVLVLPVEGRQVVQRKESGIEYPERTDSLHWAGHLGCRDVFVR